MGDFRPSPFFHPGPTSTPETLSILHLKRDLLIPTTLKAPTDPSSDYAEGHVANTRFGSFPHSTLLDLPWGSQVVASKVDTGSRGSKSDRKKRKRETSDDGETPREGNEGVQPRAAVAAGSGFIHLLPPTPESWTLALPHRTQVVYTPDYSYVLQRLCVRPGDTIIEAGAGSGSFTHAAARAVFNGYPQADEGKSAQNGADKRRRKEKRTLGKVFSFEFHEHRVKSLQEEIKEHGLNQIVTVIHRDVYEGGFNVHPEKEIAEPDNLEPRANAIFLDLPAPWLALKHLTRKELSRTAVRNVEKSPASPGTTDLIRVPFGGKLSQQMRDSLIAQFATVRDKSDIGSRPIDEALTEHLLLSLHEGKSIEELETFLQADLFGLDEGWAGDMAQWISNKTKNAGPPNDGSPSKNASASKAETPMDSRTPFRSPLNPRTPVHICTFSPCISQVERTVSTMRDLGWVEISMVEVLHRRIEVRRDRVGLQEEGLRGANASAATVDEAVTRLREVEGRIKVWNDQQQETQKRAKNSKNKKTNSAQGPKSRNTGNGAAAELSEIASPTTQEPKSMSKAERLKANELAASKRKLWKEGNLVHRTEPELKTHTSYLVFATLPRVWTAEDEEKTSQRWNKKKGEDK